MARTLLTYPRWLAVFTMSACMALLSVAHGTGVSAEAEYGKLEKKKNYFCVGKSSGCIAKLCAVTSPMPGMLLCYQQTPYAYEFCQQYYHFECEEWTHWRCGKQDVYGGAPYCDQLGHCVGTYMTTHYYTGPGGCS